MFERRKGDPGPFDSRDDDMKQKLRRPRSRTNRKRKDCRKKRDDDDPDPSHSDPDPDSPSPSRKPRKRPERKACLRSSDDESGLSVPISRSIGTKPPHHDGNEYVEAFLTQFSICAKHNRW